MTSDEVAGARRAPRFGLARSHAPELLDLVDGAPDAQVTREALCENLRDIARYNRMLGVDQLMWRLVYSSVHAGRVPAVPGAAFIGLDVGTGAGDFAAMAAQLGHVRWVGLDVSPAVLRCAGHACELLAAEGQRLPFADDSFDVVTCAQTLHHLEPRNVVCFMQECRRVARRGAVIVDLARSYRALIGAWLLTRATSRNAMTRADGVLSARRAYTLAEAHDMALQAGWTGARARAQGLFQFSIAWRKR